MRGWGQRKTLALSLLKFAAKNKSSRNISGNPCSIASPFSPSCSFFFVPLQSEGASVPICHSRPRICQARGQKLLKEPTAENGGLGMMINDWLWKKKNREAQLLSSEGPKVWRAEWKTKKWEIRGAYGTEMMRGCAKDDKYVTFYGDIYWKNGGF